MHHQKSTILLCSLLLFFLSASPALANTATDQVGAATTLYQTYLHDGATGEIRLQTNVAGESPAAETYINGVLDLSTRLLPFSLDASLQYYSHVDPTTFFVNFRGRDYNDLNQQVQHKAREIVADAAIYRTDYEKLRYINNYLVDNCDYLAAAVKDPDRYPKAFTAYGCLVEGQAVCEGYANSVQLLCEMMNIPCLKVTGTAYGGDHIWNAVYLNDKWWMLDVTFNDPIGKQDNSDRWSYFLLDLDTFRQKGTHNYDRTAYEISKEIYTGRTVGQKHTSVPFAGLSLQNAVSGDVADDRYLTDILGEDEKQTVDTPASSNHTAASSEATEKKAQALKELGLFVGDEGGFRLNDGMTRVEMGVMVMRMHDGVAALREKGDYYASICPFTDVPNWARSSIGFLYEQKLVAGQSADTFGTGAVSKRDYAVMMLRVLEIEHSYQDALAIAVTHGILTEEQAAGSTVATRGDIVDMTYATLQLMEEQQKQTKQQEQSEQQEQPEQQAA